MATRYDCPECGAVIVDFGKVLGADDYEANTVAIDVLTEVRRVVFDHMGRDSEFYDRWLGPAVTDMGSIPGLVEAALARLDNGGDDDRQE